MKKTVLITGCSSGIGKTAAYYYAEQGWNVVATMRDISMGAVSPSWNYCAPAGCAG